MKFEYFKKQSETIGRHIAEGTLTDQAVVFELPAGRRDSPLSIAIQPQAGATVQIHTTLSSPDKLAAGQAVWVASGHGDIAEAFSDVGRGACTAVRLTVTGTVDYQMQV